MKTLKQFIEEAKKYHSVVITHDYEHGLETSDFDKHMKHGEHDGFGAGGGAADDYYNFKHGKDAKKAVKRIKKHFGKRVSVHHVKMDDE